MFQKTIAQDENNGDLQSIQPSDQTNSFKCYCSSIKTGDKKCQYDSTLGTYMETCIENQSVCYLESISSSNPRNTKDVLYLAGCTESELTTPDCYNLASDVQDCTMTCSKSLCNSPNSINPKTNNTIAHDLAKYAEMSVLKNHNGTETNNGNTVFGATLFLYLSLNLF